MLVTLKRIDSNIPLPEYKTSGAVAMDLAARTRVVIAPKTVGYVPLNVVVKIPGGCLVILAARSSTHKMGLMPANGIGLIDRDYCGENDELMFAAYNFTDQEVVIEPGIRVAQMTLMRQEVMEISEVEKMGSPDRGGFGTTGK